MKARSDRHPLADLTFSLLTFFTGYASPLITPWPIIDQGDSPTKGITDILLITSLTIPSTVIE